MRPLVIRPPRAPITSGPQDGPLARSCALLLWPVSLESNQDGQGFNLLLYRLS